MLRSLVVTCVLALATAGAWAQPAQTDTAKTTVATDEQKVGQLTTSRAKILQRYQEQLDAVDRLKKEKASWRRDRELRANLADASDSANQLGALNQQLGAATNALTQARRALVAAIDRELAAGGVAPARAAQLAKLRADVAAKLGPAPKKIVLPDAEIDPNADPEELDQQAQDIADTEKQLASQVAGLDAQAAELAHVADLRKHNERAKDLMLAEDDQPHRNAQPSTGTKQVLDGAPTVGGGAGGVGGGTDHGGDQFSNSSSFESEATFVLGEVIDRGMIEKMTNAQRSGDPQKRAEAALAARNAVAARLDQLHKKRAQIEQRAKQLRKH